MEDDEEQKGDGSYGPTIEPSKNPRQLPPFDKSKDFGINRNEERSRTERTSLVGAHQIVQSEGELSHSSSHLGNGQGLR